MRTRQPFAKWLVILGALHAIVVCAGFFAPYDPIEQDRKNPYLRQCRFIWWTHKGVFTCARLPMP